MYLFRHHVLGAFLVNPHRRLWPTLLVIAAIAALLWPWWWPFRWPIQHGPSDSAAAWA